MLTVACATFALVFSATPTAHKGFVSLADHVDAATLICIGRVERVIDVAVPEDVWPGQSRTVLPVARVAVERVLKGAADIKTVHHEAWGTWTCDTTTAEVGQRALFLLGPFGEVEKAPREVRDAFLLALGTETPLRNIGSGDGIVRIAGEGDQEHAFCSGAPKALRAGTPRYASRLSDLVSYIETLVRFAPESSVVHARCLRLSHEDGEARQAFDLRILSDGSCRLAVRLGVDETVRSFRMEPYAWRSLQADLDLSLQPGEHRIGDFDPRKKPMRALTVRTREAALDFAECDRRLDPAEPEDLATYSSALHAWSTVRSAVDCAECADYRPGDRAWLEAR